jgi:hypothetical protein
VFIELIPLGHWINEDTMIELNVNLSQELIMTEAIVTPDHYSEDSVVELAPGHVILPTNTDSRFKITIARAAIAVTRR